ncbi:hypothetical protein V8F33_000853 [Rhypophila sp. PSN 637]
MVEPRGWEKSVNFAPCFWLLLLGCLALDGLGKGSSRPQAGVTTDLHLQCLGSAATPLLPLEGPQSLHYLTTGLGCDWEGAE